MKNCHMNYFQLAINRNETKKYEVPFAQNMPTNTTELILKLKYLKQFSQMDLLEHQPGNMMGKLGKKALYLTLLFIPFAM